MIVTIMHEIINLKTAVVRNAECNRLVYVLKICEVTLLVMSKFLNSQIYQDVALSVAYQLPFLGLMLS